MSSEQKSSRKNHITLGALWQAIPINISAQNTKKQARGSFMFKTIFSSPFSLFLPS